MVLDASRSSAGTPSLGPSVPGVGEFDAAAARHGSAAMEMSLPLDGSSDQKGSARKTGAQYLARPVAGWMVRALGGPQGPIVVVIGTMLTA